jgi:hypothetical protein
MVNIKFYQNNAAPCSSRLSNTATANKKKMFETRLSFYVTGIWKNIVRPHEEN